MKARPKLLTTGAEARDFIMLKPHKNENEEVSANQAANNKCAEQSARMRRLVCAFVVRKLFRVEANMMLKSRLPGLRLPTRIVALDS